MCRANRITEKKKKCCIYLWCKENKANNILKYIYENTNGFIKDKVFIYNTTNNSNKIDKYIIENTTLKDDKDDKDDKNNNNIERIKMFKNYVKLSRLDIDNSFIDLFFEKFNTNNKFYIDDIKIAKYLAVTCENIRKRLNNMYGKKINFIENIDYVKIKQGKTSSKTYYVSYECFEKLTSSGDNPKSIIIKSYFDKIIYVLINYNFIITYVFYYKNT
jgi:hypothetical protein